MQRYVRVIYQDENGNPVKLCNTCQVIKPFNCVYFGLNKAQPSGLAYTCRLCERDRQNDYAKRKKKGYIPPPDKVSCQPKVKKKKQLEEAIRKDIENIYRKEEIPEDDMFGKIE